MPKQMLDRNNEPIASLPKKFRIASCELIEEPLLFNGKPLNLRPVRPIFARLAAWLDRQPNNKLFSANELSEQSSVGPDSVTRFRTIEEFAPYCHKSPGGRPTLYFGNPRAVERLRARFAAEGK
jgi:hypothetical protein